jgi:hypothetical protein
MNSWLAERQGGKQFVFPVEIRLAEPNEAVLTARMTEMREWLDHRRLQPLVFRYTFETRGLVFRVDFNAEADAAAFARAFGGRVVLVPAETQAAD